MAELLSNFSNALAETVSKAAPSVVRVEGRRGIPASGIVWWADGVIVTAHHVLERDDNLEVGLADGQSLQAALVGRDPTTDLAVLRVKAIGLPAVSRGSIENLRVGHLALALGRPGESVRATMGVVSALGKGWRTPTGGEVDRYLQTDLVMYPGFSGGPLVDAEGKVQGVNTSAILRGVSLAVPIGTINRVVEALQAHGRIRRGKLGIGAQPARLSEGVAGQAGQETGLLVVAVEKGSAADAAGLLMGDTIVSLDGQSVRHLDDLLALLSAERIGKRVSVRIIRGGQPKEITVAVAERT
ncbi:MAG: PDZ domain-containing protein [SAR202 cluster bacterium]|nr:PDZ domain-containing protein [SAR202 cluster bacterium]